MSRTILAHAALTHVVTTGEITAADAAARTITGRVVELGQVGHTSAGRVRFAAGSLSATDPRRIKLLVEHDSERVVGHAVQMAEADGHVVATFAVAPGQLGDEVLASAAAGLRDGLSVGATITASAWNEHDQCTDVTAAAWRETSVVAVPAYDAAVITQVAASTPTPAGPSLVPARRTPAGPPVLYGSGPVSTAGRPETLTAACERIAAAWQHGGPQEAVRAALTDIVPPATQGDRDLVFPPQWVGELWKAGAVVKRTIIDSIQRQTLTSMTVNGFTIARPSFGVDSYAGNKAAIPSPGGFDLSPASAPAKRVAGGHDIDRIFFDLGGGFGSAGFLQSYFTLQTQNYLEKTEALVSAELLPQATVLPAAPTDVLTALNAVASYLGGIGASLSFVKVAPDLFGDVLAIPAADAPWLYGGSANIVDGTAVIGGIRIAADPTLAAGTLLAGDSRCATYYEWKNPPLKVEAVSIPNGGVDLAVFGYYALLVNDATALCTVTVTTTP